MRRAGELEEAWALIWLTEKEIAHQCLPPEDTRRESEHTTDGGYNAWDDPFPEEKVWIVEIDDPNVGITPDDSGETAYRNADEDEDDDWAQWCEERAGRSHIGGTVFPIQSVIPENLSPYYLEIGEIGGDDKPLFASGGNCQIDLENDFLDWQS